MLGSTIALIATVTPFALPPLVPILLLFYFIYLYFQVQALRMPPPIIRQIRCQSVAHTLASCSAVSQLPYEKAHC
jgi:hypothetical protein